MWGEDAGVERRKRKENQGAEKRGRWGKRKIKRCFYFWGFELREPAGFFFSMEKLVENTFNFTWQEGLRAY